MEDTYSMLCKHSCVFYVHRDIKYDVFSLGIVLNGLFCIWVREVLLCPVSFHPGRTSQLEVNGQYLTFHKITYSKTVANPVTINPYVG
jgi:hypothetical protein